MINIQNIRKTTHTLLAIGSHKPIIQSMLDFDYLCKKDAPSIKAIIATGRNYERFFFGKNEILIPVYQTIELLPDVVKQEVTFFFNTTSARRAKQTSMEACTVLPNLLGGTIFAEDMPERHAIELYNFVKEKQKCIIGPSSVGLLIPQSIKIGAIGGTDYRQLLASNIITKGNIAVLSASGGMVGEIIRVVAQNNGSLSFSLSFGGDRFPILSPKEAFLAAEKDEQTKTVIYYGELGGSDEYELAELLHSGQFKKKVICYIAGTVSDLFDSPPQFGHAKAIAKKEGESAREKRHALKKAGALVAESFEEFVTMIKNDIQTSQKIRNKPSEEVVTLIQDIQERKTSLITSTISHDKNDDTVILGEPVVSFTTKRTFAGIVGAMFLGKNTISKELESFIDTVLRIAVDHGPYVSGAMNTIVTARAGRDLVSSLSAGLLTIGPRFGGAINEAAKNWLDGVKNDLPPYSLVESFASKKQYISGIGHKKYRIDNPDPRVEILLTYSNALEKKRFTNYALSIQKITTSKKGNLILNVDGAIAAIMLDLLSEKEQLSDDSLERLTQIEFFNALFVLSRSVGFISHFLDQKRLDEGLFRLPIDLVAKIENP